MNKGKMFFIICFSAFMILFLSADFISAQEDENDFDLTVIEIAGFNWSSTNLNTSKFRNKDIIPEAKTEKEWEDAGSNKQPAWCWPKDKNGNPDHNHGKLYNWYAVVDERGLAPEGYKIPDESDWKALLDYAKTNNKNNFYQNVLNFKSTQMWEFNERDKKNHNPNGFNALPAGLAGCDGGTSNYGYKAFFWSYKSKAEEKQNMEPDITISHHTCFWISLNNDMNISSESNCNGYSVRCIKTLKSY